LRWGGAWDIDFTGSDESPEDMVANYVARRRKARLRAFIDGPHFELPKAKYP
jgi:peptidoglycan L-alanyl-D-glutamate endopeptidase CwlK